MSLSGFLGEAPKKIDFKDRVRNALRDEPDMNKAVDLACNIILAKEYWRSYSKYPFSIEEIILLRKIWGGYHGQ